jgi:hypothetical protein
MHTIKVIPYGRDSWLRQRYKVISTGTILVDVEDVEQYGTPPKFTGTLHTITEEGEPDCPVKATIEITKNSIPHS